SRAAPRCPRTARRRAPLTTPARGPEISVGAGVSSGTGAPRRRPVVIGPHGTAVTPSGQDLLRVDVAEDPRRVEPVADGDEVVEMLHHHREILGGPGVHLPPVRPAARGEEDLLGEPKYSVWSIGVNWCTAM